MKDLENQIPPASVLDLASVYRTAETSGIYKLGNVGCRAVVVERAPNAALKSWIEALDPELLPNARGILRPDGVLKAVHQVCDQSGIPEGAERDAFAEDITDLSTHFAAFMNAPYLRLRLDVITTNACRKFHIDAVTARLVCTYRGQATQLAEIDASGEPGQIMSVSQGCPVVMRGTNWADDAPTRLRHRSPPIEGTGETRLLLVLDPIYDLENDTY
ncbi:DUF1826 domain-containing protein [Epibacterium ulvae]|uniref:DUF1826 domain-containing protein n=1 Tax=Epibacterium ulvae TaxID=1156985 RepID=UPI0024913DBF|nr:DUF1826 domain-containing protein [Epibacterium ulvae]